MCGDFNMVADTSQDCTRESVFCIRNSVPFNRFFNKSGMVDAWHVFHLDETRYTHASPNSMGQIDYFLTSELLLNRYLNRVILYV